jgi:hypothetical protein
MEQLDWGYALSTLIIRFVGIFVVLGMLQVVMQISGRIFAHLETRKQDQRPGSPRSKEPTPEEIAAIALSLYLDDRAD